jgi:hypothetical protein
VDSVAVVVVVEPVDESTEPVSGWASVDEVTAADDDE